MEAISVKNLTKKYNIIGEVNNDLLLRDNVFKLFLKLLSIFNKKNNDKIFFALKDVNLEIANGDILGVIGSNGAGKSTLLKILSQITYPTTGEIKIKGKIASLLEVGTGFHPELSGRENIFFNGSILGMKQKEIKEKFDDILDFSGVEEFIDMPIKYYSSGMQVRLAFSVAAFLETEILLIDEVLAVGDMKFQEKCLKKMNEISNNAKRTIVFVSHNLEAIKNICTKVVWLENGMIKESGETTRVVHNYINYNIGSEKNISFSDQDIHGNDDIKIKEFKVLSRNTEKYFTINTDLELQCEFWSLKDFSNFNISIVVYNTEQCAFNTVSPVQPLKKGLNKYSCLIPGGLMNDGVHYAKLILVDNGSVLFELDEMCKFNLIDEREHEWYGKWIGAVRPKLSWKIENNIK